MKPTRLTSGGIVALTVLFLASEPLLLAEDWPQLFGPRRDGTSTEKRLLATWDVKGPPKVWERKVGEGYSGPVVAGKRLILFHRVGDQEVVECLDAGTGKEQWKFAYECTYRDSYGKGDGPRATPVIAGGRVYSYGVEGVLTCLELDSGKKLWAKDLAKDYKIPASFFGIGTTPLVEGDKLLLNVGGKEAGIVAFDAANGKEIWRATKDGASYSSPVAATMDGVRQVLFLTRAGIVSLLPDTGKVRFQQPFRARINASVNAAAPLVVGDFAFFSASYDTGGLLLKLNKNGEMVVWKSEESMANHYNTCVHHEGFLYGIDGRQETGASLRCIELVTGKVRWDEPRFGCATLIVAEGNLIALTEKGELVLVEANPKKFVEKARALVLQAPPSRAPMALAEGRLYARDQEKLICWNMAK